MCKVKEAKKWDKFGFTTGMAAAAASMAAAELVASGRHLTEVSLATPDGRRELTIDISAVEKMGAGAKARVVKCAGPDRDITDGLSIEAAVVPNSSGVVKIGGGIGIGRVTRPGLAAAVGEAAINPVPLAHIERLVGTRFPGGADVCVSAPEGVELANKTFNPRLGIVGGISILGTRGTVRPMSLASWKTALLPQLDQAAALGHKVVVLTPGNLGATAAAAFGFTETAIVQMGNFAAFMVRAAAKRGLGVLVIGHLGKIVKIACGYGNTHNRKTPDRMELLALLTKQISPGNAEAVGKLASAEAAALYLKENAPTVLSEIARLAGEQVDKWAPKSNMGAVITNLAGEAVGEYPQISEIKACVPGRLL